MTQKYHFTAYRDESDASMKFLLIDNPQNCEHSGVTFKKKENNFRSNLTDMHNCFYVELDLNLSFTSYHTISYKLKWFNYKYACAFTTIDIAKCHRFKDLSKIVNFIRFEISAKARRWQTMGKVSFSLMAWIFL